MTKNKPSNNDKTPNFSSLPRDMRDYLSQFFPAVDFKNLSLVSKDFYRLAHGRMFWQKTVKKHFPKRLPTIKPEINLDWARVMKGLEVEAFDTHTRMAAIRYLILEGEVEKLRAMKLTIADLVALDNMLHSHLFSIPELINNQSMLDLFYEIANHWFTKKAKKHPVEGMVYENGSTLLTWAIWCKQPLETIQSQIAAGAEVNQFAEGDYSALYTAAQVGYLACMPLLFEHDAAVHEACGGYNWSAIYISAMNGYLDCMNYLLDHGADVDDNISNGGSMFAYAASHGQVNSLKLLIQRGAKIHANDNFALNEALRMAAGEGQTECLKYLITLGADVNSKDNVNMTALHYAAENSHIQTMELLLKHGADVNSGANFIDTPLYCALIKPTINMQAIEFLVEHGAKLNYESGANPLACAASNDAKTKAIEYLLSKGANVNGSNDQHPIIAATSNLYSEPSLKKVRMLIEHGANLDVFHPESGMSPLSIAASHDHAACVTELLNAGASVDLVDNHKRTALDYAAEAPNESCVIVLLDHNANPNITFHANDFAHDHTMRLLREAQEKRQSRHIRFGV